MSDNKTSSNGIGFTGLLFIVFLVLKLTEVIDWSWWWITAPLWGGIALFVVMFPFIAWYVVNKEKRRKKQPPRTYFGLSPCVTRLNAGQMFDYNPRGNCVFFKDGLCNIHSVSPFECATYIHTHTNGQPLLTHKECAKSWDTPRAKKLIKELLGFTPEPIEDDASLNLLW